MPGKIQLINAALLAAVSAEARDAPRLRKNRNFHPDNAFPAHRLLNALQPGSYIPPHRHNDPRKDETMVVLQGELGLVEFDASGKVLAATRVSAGSPVCGCDIPHGVYHSVLALAADTVFLEAKSGPYAALTEDEKAAWAPQEGEAEAGAYLAGMASLFA